MARINHGRSWVIVENSNAQFCLVEPLSIMVVISDDWWWLVMIGDDKWWLVMVCNVWWIIMMDSNDKKTCAIMVDCDFCDGNSYWNMSDSHFMGDGCLNKPTRERNHGPVIARLVGLSLWIYYRQGEFQPKDGPQLRFDFKVSTIKLWLVFEGRYQDLAELA